MRGNKSIEYKQLGLDYTLDMFEILFNCGVCWLDNGDFSKGRLELNRALKWVYGDTEKAKHVSSLQSSIIQLPKIIYRPCQKKVDNLNQIDYLGTSSVVSAIDAKVSF